MIYTCLRRSNGDLAAAYLVMAKLQQRTCGLQEIFGAICGWSHEAISLDAYLPLKGLTTDGSLRSYLLAAKYASRSTKQ